MVKLNKVGEQLGEMAAVTAMTDVTGFGLLGHLIEICEGSRVAAEIDFNNIPLLDPVVEEYRQMGCIPGGGGRNFESYGHHVSALTDQQQQILCDPQTSGGLLVAVTDEGVDDFLRVVPEAAMVGRIVEQDSSSTLVNVA